MAHVGAFWGIRWAVHLIGNLKESIQGLLKFSCRTIALTRIDSFHQFGHKNFIIGVNKEYLPE